MKKITIIALLMISAVSIAQSNEYLPTNELRKSLQQEKKPRLNPSHSYVKFQNGGEFSDLLYVLNNEILDSFSLQLLKPNDIKSITVLKGKDAIDLFGEKAKNGVMLIETHDPDFTLIREKDEKPATFEQIKEEISEKPILAI